MPPIRPDHVIVSPEGQLRAVGQRAREVLRARPGNYRMILGLSGMLVLCQDSPTGNEEDGDRVLLAGEIISSGTIVEVINMISAQRWHGQLQILGTDSHRVLLIDRGILTYASSTDPADRLDHVIVNQGLLTQEQLNAVAQDLDGSRRFGEVLLARHLIDHETLFKCLQNQVEQIFFSAIMVSKGRFLFSVPSRDSFTPPVAVHLPIDSLLLDGVGRIDEMALYRKRIPNNAVRPHRSGTGGAQLQEEMLRRVLEACDGTKSITQIAKSLAMDEFQCVRVVYHLLEEGYVAFDAKPQFDVGAVRSLVEKFNGILEEIFSAGDKSGARDSTLELVSSWMQSGYASYLRGALTPEGKLDAGRIAAALESERIPDPVRSLHQALHDLVSFALFATSSVLPRETESSLLRTIPHQLSAIVT